MSVTPVAPAPAIKYNAVLDFIERVGWTAIQAAAGAIIVALGSPDMTWQNGVKVVVIAAVVAAAKVIAAQQFGNRGSGDAIPGGVVAPAPPTT